jgi:phage repressor protein C with HTH and peptisase S24 domain
MYANANISPEWLITGKGEMVSMDSNFISKDEQNRELQAKPSEKGIPLIPLDTIAGFSNSESTAVMEYECERYVIPNFRGAEFLIQVKGSSMYPKYSSGDIVACKKLPLDTFFQWNKVYVLDTEQGVLIKRVKPAEDKDHILCISDNEKYDPFELHKKDILSVSIVIGVIRLE